jgi:hypothetical protein
MQASRLDQIHIGRKCVFQVREQPAEIKQVSAFIEVYKEIDVALRVAVAGCDGTKHAHVAASVQFRQAQNSSGRYQRLTALPGNNHYHDVVYSVAGEGMFLITHCQPDGIPRQASQFRKIGSVFSNSSSGTGTLDQPRPQESP